MMPMGTSGGESRARGLVAGLAAATVVLLAGGVASAAWVASGGGFAAGKGLSELEGRIAFARGSGADLDIWTVSADGTGLVQVTSGESTDSYPTFSPDGTRIAYESTTAEGTDVWMVEAAGGGAGGGTARKLTADPGDERFPAFSPDGRTLAFASDRTGNFDIYTIALDSDRTAPTGAGPPDVGETAARRLTDTPLPEYGPVWSSDGTRIFFQSLRDGDSEIYVMNADGTGTERLTSSPGDDELPAVSPDGEKLAFTSARDGNPEVYVMDATGGAATRVTDDAAVDSAPAWSPDGEDLVFQSSRRGGSKLWIVPASGGRPTRLTEGDGSKSDFVPDWAPPPPA
ncbi:MAG: hypothetical protein ACT4OS_10170 [Acidimicrobiales bacterium]